MNTQNPTKQYFRCTDCLAPMVIKTTERRMKAGCPYCGGNDIEHMGTVGPKDITRETVGCPCDNRCIFASGPVCDCQCCGANHGDGYSVIVQVTGETAKIVPQSKRAMDKQPEYLMAGTAFRVAMDLYNKSWDNKFGPYMQRRNNGEWLQGGDWSAYNTGYCISRYEMPKIRRMRSHLRTKRILEVVDRINAFQIPVS